MSAPVDRRTNGVDPELLGWALSEIAGLAAMLRSISPRLVDALSEASCKGGHSDAGVRETAAEALHDAECLQHLASQAGWLADNAMRWMGNPGVIGDAEAWMLPPAYHEARRRLAQQPDAKGGDHA